MKLHTCLLGAIDPPRSGDPLRLGLLGLLLLMPGGSAHAADPLEVVGGLGDMVNTALSEDARELFGQRDRVVAGLDSRAAIAERQRYVRDLFVTGLGGFPERTPLRPRITGTLERDGYRVEMLVYESLPGFHVTANVYLPRGQGPPFPAVLGVAGHSDNGKASATYQHAWISMAKRGFIVLAFDPPGQGERSLYFDPDLGRSRVGIGTREHTLSGLQCLLTGHHFARYELWDAIRGVDYLLTRDDVDPERLAVAGNSGGGTQAAYLAVVEPRLAVAVSSCYMTSWKQLWFEPGPQDAEQDLPGFLAHGLDFADYATVFAPRPFTILSAVRDFFPIAGARAAYDETRHIYETLGAPDRAGFFEYDDTHGWSQPRREATYRWLERWLHDRVDEGLEPALETELESDLYATPTGQVSTSYEDTETVQTLNRAVAEEMFPGRAAASLDDPEALRALVRARLLMGDAPGHPTVTSHGTVDREGYRIEKLALGTAPGITVPAHVFVPDGGPARKPAVLSVDGAGKASAAGEGGDLEALARSGHVVLAPDVRGTGESGPTSASGGYRPVWQMLQRALLVNRTVVGMQVEDLLAALDYLEGRDDVDSEHVAVLGRGQGGILALSLAVLRPGIEKVALEGTVLSYLEIARAPYHENLVASFVPGILKDFDLPDLAAALAPRPLWIVDPRSPTGALVAVDRARSEYDRAVHAFERAGRADALRVLHRPEGWPVEKVYSGWLAL
ncbi:MAG: alpha/beta hydrolase family protein [Acidobacteria bacterium]|nr:alpha/beta hydrolase family protein [Acidobacteriota bacterium]